MQLKPPYGLWLLYWSESYKHLHCSGKFHPKKGFLQCFQDKGGSHAHVRAGPSSGNHYGKKDLFKGLVIEKLETEWTEYPVLHFDMSLAKHLDKEKLNEYLVWQLREYNGKYGLTKNNDAEVNVQLADLIKRAYEQTGRQVVVLIDEYDALLLDVFHEEENLPVLRNVMHNFLQSAEGMRPLSALCFLDRCHQVRAAQHVRHFEQYLECQYVETIRCHLWYHSGRNAGADA